MTDHLNNIIYEDTDKRSGSLLSIIERLTKIRRTGDNSTSSSTTNQENNQDTISNYDEMTFSTIFPRFHQNEYYEDHANMMSASKRKSSNPCKFSTMNENESSCGDEVYMSADDICTQTPTYRSPPSSYCSYQKHHSKHRISKGAVTCVIRKLVTEMMNTVLSEEFRQCAVNGIKRSGRKPKLWCSSVAHLSEDQLRDMAEANAQFMRQAEYVDTSGEPPLKRRRGRQPLESSPIIPKLLNDIILAVCMEVDGECPSKSRRGRSTVHKLDSIARLPRRPRGRPPMRSRLEGRDEENICIAEAISKMAQADALSSFGPLLQAAASSSDTASMFHNLLHRCQNTKMQQFNFLDANSLLFNNENALANIIQSLPDNLSQLAIAHTLNNADGNFLCDNDFGSLIFRNCSRRGRCNINPQPFESTAISSTCRRKRGKVGRPRGSGRAMRGHQLCRLPPPVDHM